MMNLFKTIRDRLNQKKLGSQLFTAEFTITHDERPVTRFNLNVRANGKAHAQRIMENYVDVKLTKLTKAK